LTKLIPEVVDALADAEDALPADLRTLLKQSLPVVLNANKADRGTFEAEVVGQAQKALGTVQSALEQKHKEALAKQNTIIAPAEHARRTKQKQVAEAGLEAAKNKLEASKQGKAAAQQAVHDAQGALRAAEKEAAVVEKETQVHADSKATLSNLLATEFALLKNDTSAGPAGKKAVAKLLALGREYNMDSTLLQTFPMTCKKPAASRSEFETMMFTSLQAGIDRQIDGFTRKLAEAEPIKAQKLAAVGNAKNALDRSEAALTAANDALTAAHAAHKDAGKEVSKADSDVYAIWNDMRAVCDAQDELANELKNFKEKIVTSFQQLKEKEPVPEPVEEPEPMEEAPAEAAPVAAEAAPEAQAA